MKKRNSLKLFVSIGLLIIMLFGTPLTAEAKTMSVKEVKSVYTWIDKNICKYHNTKLAAGKATYSYLKGKPISPKDFLCTWVKATIWRNGW